MTTTFVDVDVRPTLRAGGEPFGEIMAAVNTLPPGHGMRLLTTFKPVPLFSVLGSKGFMHEEREIGGGDWEVLLSPREAVSEATAPSVSAADDTDWPAPAREMDNRDLDPPEPMVRILAATEQMQPGEVLSALLCREPMFLLPELAKRGHSWRGGFDEDGSTYRIRILIGGAAESQQ